MSIIKENNNYEQCMGNVYYEIINSFLFGKISSIVEFAPGFRSKISYALEKLGFDGTLYVIDSNEKVLDYIKEKYKKIIPKANVITINLDLANSINVLPKQIDLFLSNHCIDDMIINNYIEANNLQNIFDNKENTYEKLNNYWIDLNNNEELLNILINKAYIDLSNVFKTISFKLIVISNYKSWFYYKINNIPEVQAFKVLELLKNNFKDIYEIDNILKEIEFNHDEKLDGTASIDDNILNKENWLVGTYNG